MGPLPHDHHRVALGNSYSIQAEAAPRHASAQAPGAPAGASTAGGAARAAAASVTAAMSSHEQ